MAVTPGPACPPAWCCPSSLPCSPARPHGQGSARHVLEDEMKYKGPLTIVALSTILTACGGDTEPLQYGASPQLSQPERGIMPDMVIAKPAEWGDKQPTVPSGYTISAIATDLKIPRQTLVLPNGDILVAEGRGGKAPSLKPKDIIAGPIKS